MTDLIAQLEAAADKIVVSIAPIESMTQEEQMEAAAEVRGILNTLPLAAAVARLRAVVEKLPVKKILNACHRIEDADNRCAAVDGPVPPTSTEMSAKDNQACYTALWDSREAAELAAALAAKQEPRP